MTRPEPDQLSHHIHSSYHSAGPLREWTEGSAASIAPSCLIWPLFIGGGGDPRAMQDLSPALPNQWAVDVGRLEEFLAPLIQAGLSSVLLFAH